MLYSPLDYYIKFLTRMNEEALSDESAFIELGIKNPELVLEDYREFFEQNADFYNVYTLLEDASRPA